MENNNERSMTNLVAKTITTLPEEVCNIIYEYYKPHTLFVGENKFYKVQCDYNTWRDYIDERTFVISKITKCCVYWIERNTTCWNNNQRVYRKKKYFCNVRHCEYFKDNTGGILYADKTFI